MNEETATDFLLLQGIAHIDAAEWKQAQIALEKVLQADPQAWVAWLYLAYVFRQMKDTEREEMVWQRIAELDIEGLQRVWKDNVDDPILWIAYAYALQQRGDWEGAAEIYQRRVRGSPVHQRVYYQLGIIYCKMQDWDKAARAFDDALEMAPEDEQTLNWRAYVSIQQGDDQQAVDLCQRCLALNPRNVDAYYNLGVAYGKLQQWDKAARALDRALEIDPKDERLLDYRAYVAEQQGDFTQAVDFYRRCLAVNPQDAEIRLHLANLLHDLKCIDEAEREFQAAAAFASTAAKALHGLTRLAAEGQDWERARQYAERLVQVAPDYPNSYYMVTKMCMEQGDLKGAEEFLRRELGRSPDNIDCRFDLYAVLVQTGEWLEAEAQIREALRYAPGRADLYAGLSYVLERQNYLEAAEAAAHRALELDSHNEFAQQMLDWIQERKEVGN
ncbi:MAG: tetratricopeptide repeat protein [Abditibacteriales bacterium]|nr:tetratricopeptide repeat protein [Abditibacteriales bacterium]